MPDITVGETRVLRGHWSERLADIDADINAIAAKLAGAKPAETGGPIARAIKEALGTPQRSPVAARHTSPATFQPGRALPVEFAADRKYQAVRLHYRVVNQAERWQSAAMTSGGASWRGGIPAAYTQTAYPLQYYFEVKDAPESSGLYPSLGKARTDQPYFVVRRA
jgi:hypothetical protein